MSHNTLLSPLLHALSTPMDHQAHVWLVDLQDAHLHADQWLSLLSEAEHTRASRMKHQPTRAAFITMRAALRHLLTRFIEESAADIDIIQTDQGKPILAHHTAIRFNISHSHGFGLIGISDQLDIGIDIEKRNERRSLQGIVSQFFSADEQKHFQQYPTAETFYRIWTGKEAVLKAWGTGLSMYMDKLSTLPAPDGQYHLQSNLPMANHTTLIPLSVPPGYDGALALWQASPQNTR